jgi:hypothetical protein
MQCAQDQTARVLSSLLKIQQIKTASVRNQTPVSAGRQMQCRRNLQGVVKTSLGEPVA